MISPTSDDGYFRSWAAPDVFDDGRLIVSVTEASDAAVQAYDQSGDRSGFVKYVAIVDPDASEEARRIDVPGVDGFAIAPDGLSVAMLDNRWLEEGVERYTLSVWSDDGLRPLGDGYVAVAW